MIKITDIGGRTWWLNKDHIIHIAEAGDKERYRLVMFDGTELILDKRNAEDAGAYGVEV